MSQSDDPSTGLDDPLIGTQLGRCQILRKLGQGGMGAVYLARHEGLDIEVAVKVLPPQLAIHAAYRQRFMREARMAARFAHPNAVRIHDVDEQDGQPYLVLELIRGPSFSDRLEEVGALGWREAAEAASQAAEALAAAHREGLIHRDIKPDNLMRDADGVVKVTDFGLAREAERSELSRTGQLSGSPAYMSPEQAEGQPMGPSTDVYSLGVTLHALIGGRSPFARSALMATLRATCEEPLPVLAAAPGALNQLLARMTAKAPAERPSTEQVVAMLRRLLDATPAAVPSSRPAAPARRPRRAARTAQLPVESAAPSPPRGWIAGGVGLLLVAALVAVLSRGGDPADAGGDEPGRVAQPAPTPAPPVRQPPDDPLRQTPAGGGDGAAHGSPAERAHDALVGQIEGLPLAQALARVRLVRTAFPDHGPTGALEAQLERRQAAVGARAVAAEVERLAAAGHVGPAQARIAAYASAGAPRGVARETFAQLCRALRGRVVFHVLSRLAPTAARIEADLAADRLSEAERALATLRDEGLEPARARIEALRTQLAAARRARDSAQQTAARARWQAALADAHATLTGGGLEAAPAALARLDQTSEFARQLADPRPPAALVELRCAASFARARRDALAVLVQAGRPIKIRWRRGKRVSLRTLQPAGFDGARIRFEGGVTIPIAEIDGLQQAEWVQSQLGGGADPDLVIGVALRLAGQRALGEGYLARAVGDPQVDAYCAARRLTPRPAPELETAASPGEVLRGRALLRARAEAASRGRLYHAGYELTPAQFCAALTVSWRHALGQPVRALGLDPRGRWVAAATEDGVVHQLSYPPGARAGQPIWRSPAVGGGLTRLQIDSAGRPLVAVGRAVHVLDRGRWRRVVAGGAEIEDLTCHPTRPLVALHARGGKVTVYDDRTWTTVRAGETLASSRLGWFADDRLAYGGPRQPLGIWAVAKGGRARSTDELGDQVMAVCASPDGRALVVARSPNLLELWNPAALSRPVRTLTWPRVDHQQPTRLSFHPSGLLFAVGASYGPTFLYEARTGQLLRGLEGHAVDKGHHPHPVRFTVDGVLTGGHDGLVVRWVVRGDGPDAIGLGRRGPRLTPALAAGGLEPAWVAEHPQAIRDVAVLAGAGRGLVATAGQDGVVRLIRERDGHVQLGSRPLRTLRALAAHPTRRFVVAGHGNTVSQLEFPKGAWKRLFEHDKTVRKLAFSPDGRQLAVAEDHGLLSLYDTRSWKPTARVKFVQNRTICLAWSRAGLAVNTGVDATLYQPTRTGLQARWKTSCRKGPQDVCFAPDGRWIAAVFHTGLLRVHALAGDRPLLLARDHEGDLDNCLAAHPSGTLLATSTQTGRVYVYETRGWQLVSTFLGGRTGERGNHRMAWSGDGQVLMLAGVDGTLRCFRMKAPTIYAGK